MPTAGPVFWPRGQLFTRHARIVAAIFAASTIIAMGAGCEQRAGRSSTVASSEISPRRGGEAVASVRTEPLAFSRLSARGNDSTTELVTNLTQARLVRINKLTQEVEPRLAEKWTVQRADPAAGRSGDVYTLTLREGLAFSDGHPLTTDDVLFTFQVAYDDRVGSSYHDALQVAGRKLQVGAVDARTVTITFPGPYAPGIRILDSLPIFPKHKLEAAYKAGTIASAWGVSAPPGDITGMGPFVLKSYAPGQRIVLERNPHYWRKSDDGTVLPYLDKLTLEIIRDQNAELLRLAAGQLDMTYSEVPPESYASIKRAADEGRVRLFDLGVSLDPDSFWFNLKPGAFAGDPRAAWIQRDELRQAISLAVDRKLFSDTVFFGAGEPVYLPVTPANKKWFPKEIPPAPHDPAAAKTLLAKIGATDGARFTLISQKGRPRLERGAAVIRDELKKIGLQVELDLRDGGGIVQAIMSQKYDAIYFHAASSDTDPGTAPEFWFSTGGFHFWNPGQKTPATDWEQQIDQLMRRQVAAADEAERQRLFTDVLRIFDRHKPVIYFAAPRVFVAVSSRMTNVTPAVYLAPVLWNPDSIAVAR